MVIEREIKVATPCNARWDDMTGDERVRFCALCSLNVYNISEMTEAQTDALIREREGRLCVRLYQRSDGTVITQDCPVALRRWREEKVTLVALAVMLFLGLFLWARVQPNPKWQLPSEIVKLLQERKEPPQVIMGKMQCP